MSEKNLATWMDQIEQRLDRLEDAVGLPPLQESYVLPQDQPVQQVEPLVTQLQRRREQRPVGFAPAESPANLDENPDEAGAQAEAEQEWDEPLSVVLEMQRDEPVHVSPIPPAVIAYQASVKKPPMKQTGLEQTIGLKWAGWVGAIVLVIGAGLGIKFGYDQGWFAAVPPAFRLSIMALAGCGLLAAGEWVYRKVHKLSAVGLFGAGVAVLFLVSYAGHAYYGLYERNTAFVFMTLSTLVGSAVAMRGNLVSIAVLALLGGNLAPILLHGDQNQIVGFLCYLLMLQVVALVLAWWGASNKWWTLRTLSLTGTALWMAGLLMSRHFDSTDAPLWFSLLFAGMYQAELILSAMRRKGLSATQALPPDDRNAVPFSILVTAGLTLAVLCLFQDASHETRAAWVVCLAAITGALSLVLLRESGEPISLKFLAMGFAVQSAALVALAVPVALSGIWIAAGWGILALVFAAVGMTLDLPVARFFATLVWGLAVANLCWWTQAHPGQDGAGKIWLNVAGIAIPAYARVGWLLAVAGQAVAAMTRRSKTEPDGIHRELPTIVAWASSIVWVSVTLMSLPALTATVWLVVYAWLLALVAESLGEQSWLPQCAGVLMLATIKWIVVDTLAARLSPGWTPGDQWPVLNPMMGAGILIAGSILGIYRLRTRQIWAMLQTNHDAITTRLRLMATVFVLIAFGFTLEIERLIEHAGSTSVALNWPMWQLKHMSWTLLWSLMVCAFAGLVRKMEPRTSQRADWLGMTRAAVGLIAMKFVVVDTLLYRLFDGTGHATPFFNLQILTAVVVAGALVCTQALWSAVDAKACTLRGFSSLVSFTAVLVLLWSGSMEIDRLVDRWIVPGTSGFPIWQWKNLLWTNWWMLGVCAYLLAVWRANRGDPRAQAFALNHYWALTAVLAGKFVVGDTLFWRAFHGPALATAIVNVQCLTAGIVLAGLILLLYFTTTPGAKQLLSASIRPVTTALAVLVLLTIGTIEIDRVFQQFAVAGAGPFANPALAEQVALSIFFSIFAVASVLGGFRFRLAGLRYFGLSLFAVTLLKVVTIDLGQVSTGYRILSFIGLGALLLITSVLYGKLSPMLLRE